MISDKTTEKIFDIDEDNFENELNTSGNITRVDYVDNDANKEFSVTFVETTHEYIVDKNGNIRLKGTKIIEDDTPPIVLSSIKSWTPSDNTDFHNSSIMNTITEIEFVDLNIVTVPTEINETTAWDVSENGDNSIIAWLDDTKLYIGGNGGVKANEDSSYIFYGFPNLTSINFGNNYDTKDVTNMTFMFAYSNKLESLDVSKFNTEKVTDMKGMFCGLTTDENQTEMNLTEIIGLNNFDTKNVTCMEWMFCNCGNLTTLDLSNFDTSKVTNMRSMFNMPNDLSSKLENIIFGENWETSNVENMEYMFCDCNNLKLLNVENFDTSKVTNMNGMFEDCCKLRQIYVGENWNVNNVDNSADMFYNNYLLVGGNGTEFYSSYSDKNYARIDKAGQAGYLTDIRQNSAENNTVLEYIEATGTQYIITDIIPTDTMGAYAKISSSDISDDLIYFGSKESDDSRFYIGNYSTKMYFGFGTLTPSSNRPTINENEIYNIELNFMNSRINKLCSQNDIINKTYTYKEDITNTLTDNTIPLTIFSCNYSSGVNYRSKIKMYEFKISEGNKIKYNFVPVYNTITESYGLYDDQNNKFYGNSGSGSFNEEN